MTETASSLLGCLEFSAMSVANMRGFTDASEN